MTVAITRRTEAGREPEMAAWVRTGIALAEHFPGFLGGGWVRPGADRDEWHMLYRFADAQTLAGWEGSGQRQWWLSSGRGLVEHTRTERRTGIEGWFDATPQRTVETVGTRPQPPRWKQAVVIWLLFFPLSLLGNLVLRAEIPTAPIVLRVLILTVVQIPLMTYLFLPWLTRLLSPWLNRRPR